MDDIYRSQFRLPYPLYERLKAAADHNRRSVNAELVARLERTFWWDEDAHKVAADDQEPIQPAADEPEELISVEEFRSAIEQALEHLQGKRRARTPEEKFRKLGRPLGMDPDEWLALQAQRHSESKE